MGRGNTTSRTSSDACDLMYITRQVGAAGPFNQQDTTCAVNAIVGSLAWVHLARSSPPGLALVQHVACAITHEAQHVGTA